MVVLITGATGMIGSALRRQLLSEGHVLVCQSRGLPPDPGGSRWIQFELATGEWKKFNLPNVDVVFHLAGQTSVYQARNDPLRDFDVNVQGTLRLLEHFRNQAKPPFVVFASTVTISGLVDRLPITENTADSPITFYDLSKQIGEMYLKQYVREGWIQGCSLRFANVFGRSLPGQQVDRGVIDKILKRALAGQALTVYGSGDYHRDYVFIDDIVSALQLAPRYPERTNGRHFVLGSGEALTLNQAFGKVADQVRKLTGIDVHIVHVDPPADLSDIEYRNAVVDSSAFSQATGWRRQFNFDKGIDQACRSLLGGDISEAPF